MARFLSPNVLGNYLDASFHGRRPRVVHRGKKGDKLTDVDGLPENHLVNSDPVAMPLVSLPR